MSGKCGRCLGLIVLKSGSLNILEPSRPVQSCTEFALPLQDITEVGCTLCLHIEWLLSITEQYVS